MRSSPLRILVAGGGVAAAEAVLALDTLAGDRVEIELLAPRDEFIEKPASVVTPFGGIRAPRVSLDGLPARRRRDSLAAVHPDAHLVTTTDGARLSYDRLIVAAGARPYDAVPGATQFRGPLTAGVVERVLRAARSRALFVAPPGNGWTLPAYELALLAAHELDDCAAIAVATPEPRPLDLFGRVASDALARLLNRAGIEFLPNVVPVEALDVVLVTADGRMHSADAVVALPGLRGLAIKGLPTNSHGFLEVDEHGRLLGIPDVFAAGDATAGAIKQGGLAAQQADAVAEAIAAEAGAPITPLPCRRVLRGVVLTGERPLYLRRDLDDDTTIARPLRTVARGVSRSQLWWPDGKIAGRYLTGFLARNGAPGELLADRPPAPAVTDRR
jgi:sulfide:quinone oxidoreductase